MDTAFASLRDATRALPRPRPHLQLHLDRGGKRKRFAIEVFADTSSELGGGHGERENHTDVAVVTPEFEPAIGRGVDRNPLGVVRDSTNQPTPSVEQMKPVNLCVASHDSEDVELGTVDVEVLARLVFTGDGDEEPSFESRCEVVGMADVGNQVHLVVEIDNPPEVLDQRNLLAQRAMVGEMVFDEFALHVCTASTVFGKVSTIALNKFEHALGSQMLAQVAGWPHPVAIHVLLLGVVRQLQLMVCQHTPHGGFVPAVVVWREAAELEFLLEVGTRANDEWCCSGDTFEGCWEGFRRHTVLAEDEVLRFQRDGTVFVRHLDPLKRRVLYSKVAMST